MEFTTKHEDSSVLTKDYGNALTKHEDANALMNSKPGKVFSITQMFDYRAYWTTTADKYTHWKKNIQQTMTKDDNVFHTSWKAFSTKHEDVKNALMNSKPWKAFSSTQMFDYRAYWTTLADKYTHLERGIQQTMTKDDNVLNKSWKAFSTPSRWNQNMNFRWSIIVVLLLLIISIFISIWDRSPSKFMGDVNYACQSPQVIQPWQIKAFRPKWFGLFGGPGPITHKTRGGKGHRIAIVDIDRRDIEIAIRVDNKGFTHRPVVLDNTVSCGEDLANCINMGFGAAFISVPPGNHIVRAEILDVNGTFRWEHERKRRVWWMVEQCS